MSQINSDLVDPVIEVDFSKFLEKAEFDTSFGFPSYILKSNNKYERYNTGDGQYYFDASMQNATRHTYEEANQILSTLKRLGFKNIEIEADISSDTRASNAFWGAIRKNK
jgi:hypothetical protein